MMKILRFSMFVGLLLGMSPCASMSHCQAQASTPIDSVTQREMQAVYEAARTPYKYGLVVAPATNFAKYDCPSVFSKDGVWYMTYVCYNGKDGKDGKGYETWLAQSSDLLHWQTLGRILEYPSDTSRWDACQRGGFPALQDWTWDGSYELQTYKGRNYMTYIGGHGSGYEAINEPLSIGLAWTPAPQLTTAHAWESASKPILAYNDADAQWWERLTQYKSTIYWDRQKSLGAPFVMFYNAGGIHPSSQLKGERIGIATSRDLKHWHRYAGNPVFTHEEAGVITGDAQIQRFDSLYVMFYFSAFRPTKPYKAYNTFACSRDLVHWFDWQGEDLIYPTRPFENMFAHKSCVIKHRGVVYHFYCAVNKDGQRGIAVATSRPMGTSKVHFPAPEPTGRRREWVLNDAWQTQLEGATTWRTVDVPHNWDDYYGYRQYAHGNLHANASYKKQFMLDAHPADRCYYLTLEGVGSYATVVLNGDTLAVHRPAGRLALTLDVTQSVRSGSNALEVRCEHPTMITDMPWVCGGCSSEWGFSEGSQPLGLFRPVKLVETRKVHVTRNGIHVWNNVACDTLYVESELCNAGTTPATVELSTRFNNADGARVVPRQNQTINIDAGQTLVVRQQFALPSVKRWSPQSPYLYDLVSIVKQGKSTIDEVHTPTGIRNLSWPVLRQQDPACTASMAADHRFFLNDAPLLIHGTCEYEHLFGQSHALSVLEIEARMRQLKGLGFNALRDAHQPHHEAYGRYCDQMGLLWWPQFSAHIWYDTPAFRSNFKQALVQWVKERRNEPSVMLWGLQNESTLPADFARECTELIRQLDPTCGTMRAVTTCNGGEGTDWNVIQNWSGTYGGNLYRYDVELARPSQLLNGEYGAWRSLGYHNEPTDSCDVKGPWTEERFCQLLHTKLMKAEAARDSVCGQFQWIYHSHENPGRRQSDEAYRTIDKVGPFNYKGLLSPWEQPLDAYYMYMAAYAPCSEQPMVYLASHTWPQRFAASGPRKATLQVYSNCPEVTLSNGAGYEATLQAHDARMGLYTFRDFPVETRLLKVVAHNGKDTLATDCLLLDGLPASPQEALLHTPQADAWRHTAADDALLRPTPGLQYIYRINCGGDAYTDSYGQQWMADDTLFCHSWAMDARWAADSLNPVLASQGEVHEPVLNVPADWTLMQSFRWGRHLLNYHFEVIPYQYYTVELYFMEPWWGIGLGPKGDCSGYRLFDIAINGQTVERDLDLWAEAGVARAVKRSYLVQSDAHGRLEIAFPHVQVGQAVVSAVAVAALPEVAQATESLRQEAVARIAQKPCPASWKECCAQVRDKTPKEAMPADKDERVATRYEHKVLQQGKHTVGFEWHIAMGLAQEYALRFRYKNPEGAPVPCQWQLLGVDGRVVCQGNLTFPLTPRKWRMLSTTTGTFVNAGHYTLRITSAQSLDGLSFEHLEVQ